MTPTHMRLLTAESVRRGHPDKLCDQIADAILDEHLRQDPAARVAIEVFAAAGKILIAGEVTSQAKVNNKQIALRLLKEIRYQPVDVCSAAEQHLEIEVRVHAQSPDIARAVGSGEKMGAGDQGIMVGFACNETEEMLPLPVVLAHKLCREMDRMQRDCTWLRPDGKAQVTVVYADDCPLYVKTIVLSAQYTKKACPVCMKKALLKMVHKVIPQKLLSTKTKILINPSGRFVLGGLAADTGLTGRKLAVDQYGPAARIGGGALSGKDPTKVDRSGAYMARYVAKNLVAAGLARRCEVQLAYAIGRARPVSVSVNSFGTGCLSDQRLAAVVRALFDLRPSAIIGTLSLR